MIKPRGVQISGAIFRQIPPFILWANKTPGQFYIEVYNRTMVDIKN